MATKRNAKDTKAPARKRKPAPKVTKRTMIAETMTPQPETASLADMDRLAVEGAFDDLFSEVPSRRFFWLTVTNRRARVWLATQTNPDGSTGTIPVQSIRPSPWWERALYAVARIWS